MLSDNDDDDDNSSDVSWLHLVAPVMLDLNCVYIEEFSGNVVPRSMRRLQAYDYIMSE